MTSVESTSPRMDTGRRGRSILVFSPNGNPLHDARLLKLCAYLTGSGWAVRLMWVQGSGAKMPALPAYAQPCPCVVPDRAFRDEPTKTRRLIKLLRTVGFVVRALRHEETSFLWVCGLSSLVLTAPYLAVHRRVRFVYDAVEYSLGQYECVGKNHKSLRQRAMICGIVTVEQWASSHAVAVVHTNRWRRRLFEHSHPVARTKSFILESLHCRSLDDKGSEPPSPSTATVGYVGAISAGRALGLLVESLRFLPSEYTVVIAGTGNEQERAAVMKNAQDLGVAGRVNLIPPVPYWELQRLCHTFTCGAVLIEDNCLNNRYCSPNKVFDFIAASCPSVVTGVPPLRELVRSRGIGVVVSKPVEAASVAAAIRQLAENRAFFQRNCSLASDSLDWSSQSGTVDTVVNMASE